MPPLIGRLLGMFFLCVLPAVRLNSRFDFLLDIFLLFGMRLLLSVLVSLRTVDIKWGTVRWPAGPSYPPAFLPSQAPSGAPSMASSRSTWSDGVLSDFAFLEAVLGFAGGVSRPSGGLALAASPSSRISSICSGS